MAKQTYQHKILLNQDLNLKDNNENMTILNMQLSIKQDFVTEIIRLELGSDKIEEKEKNKVKPN